MKYLKVFTDFADDIELLADNEVGRLFRAMLQYAEDGTIPDLKGNERFVWVNAKKKIDIQREKYESKCENMEKARNAISINRALLTNNSALLSNNGQYSSEEQKTEEQKNKTEDKEKENNISFYLSAKPNVDYEREYRRTHEVFNYSEYLAWYRKVTGAANG